MNPVVVASIAAAGLFAIVVLMSFLRDVFDERAALTREQREREDAARRQLRSDQDRDLALNITARIFDPLSLFH